MSKLFLLILFFCSLKGVLDSSVQKLLESPQLVAFKKGGFSESVLVLALSLVNQDVSRLSLSKCDKASRLISSDGNDV